MKFSFSQKLLVLFCVPLLLICVIVCSLSVSVLRQNLHKEIQQSLKIAASSLDVTYSSFYEGDYTTDLGGGLHKGSVDISQNYDLLDEIKESVGVDTSFYYGKNIRLTTLRLESGARAIGLQLTDSIYKKVLAGEEVFVPEFTLQGVTFFGYFQPLRNADGSVVGVIFAGKTAEEVSNRISSEVIKILLPSLGVMLVFLAAIAIFARSLSRNMKVTKRFLEKVATGNLRIEDTNENVESGDEIGDIFRMSLHLQEELRKIVSNVKNSSDMLTTSSNELLAVSRETGHGVSDLYGEMENMSKDASMQAEQTAESVENIYNISTQIELISKEIEVMGETVEAMSEAEKKSSLIMRQLDSSNQEMSETIGKVANQIDITNTSVQSIQRTIDIIREIADETDLLSLNASIEAARAGNSGLGFAVIAEQISKLASLSAENAGNVEKTLITLKSESEKMVTIMDEVKERMNTQSLRMNETMENFSYVAGGVESSLSNVQNINERMDELDHAKELVLEKVRILSDISNKFVSATEGMTHTTGTMDSKMKDLRGTAKQLDHISEGLSSGLVVFKL